MLRIHKLVTECRVPAGHQDVYALADSIGRESLAPTLAGFLGPSLSRNEGVVHIQRLRVCIRVRGKTIDRQRLVNAWVRAICTQLFTALSYPAGGGHFQIEKWESQAAFRAAFLRDLVAGTARSRWAYRCYARLHGIARADAVMSVLRDAPAQIVETLEACERAGALEAILSVLDDLRLEEIFRIIAATNRFPNPPPSPEDFRATESFFRSHPIKQTSRAAALRQFVLAQRAQISLHPRVWLRASTALQLLSQHGELWIDSARPVSEICGHSVASDVVELIDSIRQTEAARQIAESALKAASLARPIAKSAGKWIQLEHASLLLTIRFALRQDFSALEPRQLQAFLYAIGCALRDRIDPEIPRIDPAAAAFAGIFEEASPGALRDQLSIFSAVEALRNPLETAGRILAQFTAAIPGFRRANREEIVRQFLCGPGRIRIDDKSVLVVLEPRPCLVAARIAALDDPIEDIPWFAGRRLEFRIEGL